MPQSKKQNLKPIDGYISLPDYWSDEDKTNYELLVCDAKRYFPYMDEFVIHIGVMAHINRELGILQEFSENNLINRDISGLIMSEDRFNDIVSSI